MLYIIDMKIAITADVHLKEQNETPDRYRVVESIFNECISKQITTLLIAGDTFDKNFFQYQSFDKICGKFKNIKVIIIPGNHDTEVKQEFFTSGNIEVINSVSLKTFDGISFLLIPYISTKTMDEVLIEFISENKPDNWILVGHGDYITTNWQTNPYEPGTYMPLSAAVINKYNPLKVFLGHIHKADNFGKVYYPGSPFPLDITETGKRQFIIYDTGANTIENQFIKTEKIYFIEEILTFPVENEIDLIKKQIEQMIKNWKLPDEELNYVRLRLKVRGFTTNLLSLKGAIINSLSKYGISLYDEEGPDLTDIKVLNTLSDERIFIFNKVKQEIEKLELKNFHATKEQILEKAMELIFGELDKK